MKFYEKRSKKCVGRNFLSVLNIFGNILIINAL